MGYKTIVDFNGNIVDLCVKFINGLAQDFTIKEGHRAVERYSENFIKPFWNDSKWIESATEEEIEAWKEENKQIENIGENLIDKLILDNINMQSQIDSLIQAQLGGN
ncbi:hypothetical protein ACQR2L_13645 [Clostridium butyricum]|uniref:hypothetical protein n=1 Tax=Clostridium butyricum TaxID=1492 RepID=UPI003D0FA041